MGAPQRRTWLLAGAALVVVAAVVVVLTVTGGEEPEGPRRPAPAAKPLELTELTRLPWRGPEVLPQLRDGTVLFFDEALGDSDAVEDRRMVLADARTGEHRWTLFEYDDLPGGGGLAWDSLTRPVLVAHPTGVAVLLEYCVASCVGNPGGDGIALLSA